MECVERYEIVSTVVLRVHVAYSSAKVSSLKMHSCVQEALVDLTHHM